MFIFADMAPKQRCIYPSTDSNTCQNYFFLYFVTYSSKGKTVYGAI